MAALTERLRSIVRSWDTTTLWIATIALAAFTLLLARQAFDVLVILALCGLLFVIERTVGDWLLDALGPFFSRLVFVGGILAIGVGVLSIGRVRSAVFGTLESADELGLHSAILGGLSKVPVRSGSSSVPGGGAGAPRGTAALPAPIPTSADDAAAAPPTQSADQEPVAAPTRIVLRIGGQGGTVLLQADVLSGASEVSGGRVEFSIDGSRVSSVSVAAGRAEARTTVSSGAHRAAARYTGSRGFRDSVSEAAFSR